MTVIAVRMALAVVTPSDGRLRIMMAVARIVGALPRIAPALAVTGAAVIAAAILYVSASPPLTMSAVCALRVFAAMVAAVTAPCVTAVMTPILRERFGRCHSRNRGGNCRGSDNLA